MSRKPFILLDDARTQGARDARLYEDAREVVVARRVDEVEAALARIAATPGDWAGTIAYEAGLALEPRLAPLAAQRTGAAGPLVWFARFGTVTRMASTDVERWLASKATGPGRLGPMGAAISCGGYARTFELVQEAIRAGDIYQANLTFPLTGTWDGDPLTIYADVRRDSRSGYGGVVWDGAHWHLSFSPELFFKLADGEARVRPMKGTAPRGATPEEDARFKADLAASVKDRAENLMIVDLMRNDLARVSSAGSVKVEAPFAIESYPTVHQMVTTVRAKLGPGEDVRSLLRAIFPCGSITGAPKIRAMEVIHQAERDARGLYCGSIGRIDPSGDAAFNVAIRTVRLSGDGRAVMGVGSAVVADSAMIGEWRECVVKGNFLRLSAGHADLIETMAFDPARGIALLELHLERMKASALALGFSFDRHALRNAIHALCFDLDAPAKVRLVVSKSGAHALDASPMPAPLESLTCAVLPLPVSDGDWRLRHKTTDRGFYEAGLAAAKQAGAGEALFLRDDGLLTEGMFTNIFVECDGQLLTPRADLGLLPGVLRRSLIEAGRAVEADLTMDDLAGGFLVGNALRGLVPARLLGA
ncbi:MAG: aminodeoxychorismate synthase component I [Novosphingobium sp.]|nr:aminodeoxychorismate synthase component I [Novosphingobium sp.]